MAWKLDNPLYSLADEEETKKNLHLWETEKPGGMWESNNRLPFPLTFLIALIILTAFMITMPIWGQRPHAAIYEGFVKLMDSPEVQQIADPKEKIQYLYNQVYPNADSRTQGLLERHPLSWYDLQAIAPQIREIQQSGGPYPLDNYSIIGDKVVLANFEGNYMDNGLRERKQPWWDKGFTIDVFYVSYFIIAMVLVVKRLPHFSRKPNI